MTPVKPLGCIHFPNASGDVCALCNLENASWRIAASDPKLAVKNGQIERIMRGLTDRTQAPEDTRHTYVEVPLSSTRARKFLGIHLNNYPKKARTILRVTTDVVLVPPEKFKQVLSPAELKTIRAILALPQIVASEPPIHIPLGPEIHCPHHRGPERTYVCRECSGILQTRYTVHRFHPLIVGNGAEDFASLRFQPHMLIRSDKGHNPHTFINDNWRLDYEAQQQHFVEMELPEDELEAEDRQDDESPDNVTEESGGHDYRFFKDLELIDADPSASILQIGLATFHGQIISVPPPSAAIAPKHKCVHGVSWGADNCRVCAEIVYRGKQAHSIWQAIDRKKIRASVRNPNGTQRLYAGFALIQKSNVDRVLGVRDVLHAEDHLRYADIIKASEKNLCVICGVPINQELTHCQDCARDVLLAEPEQASGERFNTAGDAASFYESKVRPLAGRTAIDIGLVRLVARTHLCGVLSDALGQEIHLMTNETFEWLAQMSPAMMTLLRRFYMWSTGVPVADIAAFEGTKRQAIENYFTRWLEIIEDLISALD